MNKPVTNITTIHLRDVETISFHVDHGGRELSGPSVISWQIGPSGWGPAYLTGTRAELRRFADLCKRAAHAGANTNGVRPPTGDGYATLKGDHDA